MQLYLFALGGLLIATVFGISQIQDSHWYSMTTAMLLAVGLYSSTYGISLSEARRHLRLILSAVTIGVVLKAFIIGSVMTVVLRNPLGYVMGVIMSQIDPLSTAALQKGRRLSRKAKTILAAWSSFDDPVTVILSLYVPTLILWLSPANPATLGTSSPASGLAQYFTEIALNLGFVALSFGGWALVKRNAKSQRYIALITVALFAYATVLVVFAVAIYFFLMLGMALIGLFMRPAIDKLVDHAVHWALSLAALLIGILLQDSINIGVGIALGVSTFVSQMIVGYILCRRLSHKDRLHITFAQQNGITAIILALLFEPQHPGMIAIVAPAILTINVTHFVTNRILDAHSSQSLHNYLPHGLFEQLRAHLSKL